MSETSDVVAAWWSQPDEQPEDGMYTLMKLEDGTTELQVLAPKKQTQLLHVLRARAEKESRSIGSECDPGDRA